MYIGVPTIALRELSEVHDGLTNFYKRYDSDWDEQWISLTDLSDAMLESLASWLHDNVTRHTIVKKLLNKWLSSKNAMQNAETIIIKDLQKVPALVKGFANKCLPNSLMYKYQDGQLVAYTLTKAEYKAADRISPAYVDIEFQYIKHNEIRRSYITIYNDIYKQNKTIYDVFMQHEYFAETKALNDEYAELLKTYYDTKHKIGDVYIASNSADSIEDRYYSRKYYFKQDVDNKVVVDFNGYNELNDSKEKTLKSSIVKSEFADGGTVALTEHPYGYVFHLEEHKWLDIHISNLAKYQFAGAELLNKLVLPNTHKQIISLLMHTSKHNLHDIIAGKTGGSFILSTGAPGTGKTLTAEIFSEVIERPLYKVQCSQLGIKVDDVESKLKSVLRNASRWGALLLIDEADVYIRARAQDIQQNAIVGVFLRTLEYYNGILFMTSNLVDCIDDAIMSRATAHISYTKPTRDEQIDIWQIISSQFNCSLSAKLINALVNEFPNVVGRDIKSLLKLSIYYANAANTDLTLETFKDVSIFIPSLSIKS
jgi:hypothetical protein